MNEQNNEQVGAEENEAPEVELKGHQDDHDYEAEARRKGWRPKDEYEGDADKWVDAKTFVERGEKFVKNLQRKIDELQQKIESFEQTKTQVKTFYEDALKRKDQELLQLVTALKKQRAQAIREGNDDQAVEIDGHIEALQNERERLNADAEEKKQQPSPDQIVHSIVLDEWVEENPWFKTDEKLREAAIAFGKEINAKNKDLRGRKFLDKVREMMVEEFPRRFAENKPATPVAVEGGKQAARVKGKTAADLPEEDKKLMKYYVSSGMMTEETFLKTYFER